MNETVYERYLSVGTLLSLQLPASERAHRDEIFFQVIHQVEELWMKLVREQMALSAQAMSTDRIDEASWFLSRAISIMKLMGSQLPLLETITTTAYIEIRKHLANGSGEDSPGFRGMMQDAPALYKAFEAVLLKHQVNVKTIMKNHPAHFQLWTLLETLTEFDSQFQRFRYLHWCLVKRVMGPGSHSLRGKPADLLSRTHEKPLFPELWTARSAIIEETP